MLRLLLIRMLSPECRTERPAFAKALSTVEQQVPLTEHYHVPAWREIPALSLQQLSPGAVITPILERRDMDSDENTEALKR